MYFKLKTMRHLLLSRYIFTLMILLTTSIILYILHVKKARRDFIKNYYSEEIDHQKGQLIRQRMYTRTLKKIRPKIKSFNTHQKIYNWRLGPITEKTFVIVIQCQANLYHLDRLLNTLKKAFFINKAILIFSHDHYSDKMNKLIENIDYAMYMQIFYPYSTQLHPEVFPGAEPVSCIKDAPCVKSRNSEAAQSKHHWWWQANQIFDHIKALKKYTKPILFLEANNYVMIDVLFIFRLLVYANQIHCPYCEMISLASHEPDIRQYKKRKSMVTVGPWEKSAPSTAIAFDRNIWHKLKSWKEDFCSYNDSKWDNSLKHLGTAKMDGNIYLTAIHGPRVFRIEECNVNEVGCKEQDKVNVVESFTKSVARHMFPLSIKIKFFVDEMVNPFETGDWTDVRDHQLCMRFANESVWF